MTVREARVTGLAVALMVMVVVAGGCAAALGAAAAAGEIRQGLGGLQQLVSRTRDAADEELQVPVSLDAPVAGTYRGFQALGDDTLRYYVRTARRPIAAIADSTGTITGYALHGIAAVTLDTLERRVAELSSLTSEEPMGRTIFFVEGTHPPNMVGRTLYPAAFLGRIPAEESAVASRHESALRAARVTMEAPEFASLEGQAIPYELFGSVAEGIFTVRAGGAVVYEQEYELDEGQTFVLHFERISVTTLP